MLKKFIQLIGGDPNKRDVDRMALVVEQINSFEAQLEQLTDGALRAKTAEFRALIAQRSAGIEDDKERRAAEAEVLEEILPEAFAVVREASKRATGMRHFDVQMIGGMTLHNSKIAEMRTGEGKTLVATLPLYLNALTGRGTHLITVNDYLARRDARWMGQIYIFLGLSVGVLQIAARTENGRKAFLVDLDKESPHEDQHQLRLVPRAEAYAADITYGMNSEFGFDYLRDNMTSQLEDRVQRGHYFAIVDEVDNVLIDEARTPLIISGPAQDEGEAYVRMAQLVRQLRPEDYEINEKDRTVTLTELGEAHLEELLGEPMRDPDMPEDVTPEQARTLGYVEQALRAQYLYRRNKEYLVQGGKVVIVDEFTGRMMPGRRWSDGLHQAVEAKEGVKVQAESVTYATITIQNYFRMYNKLAGMSGTAITEAEEFDKIYKLGVLPIPTNLEHQATRNNAPYAEIEAKDEQGYKYFYYARKDDTDRRALYWRRKDYPDVIYRSLEMKLRALSTEILRNHALGRPMLVGTTSVELSERVSMRLRAEPLTRLMQTLLLRDAYTHHHKIEEDGRRITELAFLYNAAITELDPGMLRKLARELGLPFNPSDPENQERLAGLLDLPRSAIPRLTADLQAGIPHEVLNARKHTEESQIIAGAGAFGAVTIATNMAGRGVDIKLGGELAEEVNAAVNRVLARNNVPDPYDMTMEERLAALLRLDPAAYGIYDSEIQYFFQHMDEMAQVKALGGLHVIGTERHEARRIDNQLRGRAARQGDPGSSRFYLSMEDDLMRLFGGQQAESMMERLKVDESLPLEVGLVGRLIEQSQTRVEGSNFDVRKHLLEYDDVLNSQRARIYGERDRIFVKEDLTEDVRGMLSAELARRVPESLADEGGPWKLLAWLEGVQPPFPLSEGYYPSYTYSLLLERLLQRRETSPNDAALRQRIIEMVSGALRSENEHHLIAVREQIAAGEERLETQIDERIEAVDMFLEGLELNDETDTRKPSDLLNELSAASRVMIKMSPEDQRLLKEKPRQIAAQVRDGLRQALRMAAIGRLIQGIERRIDDTLGLTPAELVSLRWNDLAEKLLSTTYDLLERRLERLAGSDGQIIKDLDAMLARLPDEVNEDHLIEVLMMLPQGARAQFDKRTHRRTVQHTRRLSYTYYAATLLDGREARDITADVLEHLMWAQEQIQLAWGETEFKRLAGSNLSELDETTRQGILQALNAGQDAALVNQPLNSLDTTAQEIISAELGRRFVTGLYRSLLLSIITELWVDYLTQMESLRISVGLEAYAQRDPLVQYKSRAAELYGLLQSNIRLGVINRMFTFRPRDLSQMQAGVTRTVTGDNLADQSLPEVSNGKQGGLAENGDQPAQPNAGLPGSPSAAREASDSPPDGKKRKRHRR